MADPPYGVIWNRIKAGKVVPFLGAGASLVGRPEDLTWTESETRFLPSGSELSCLLAMETSFPHTSQAEQADLARVASYYTAINGRPVLRDRLHELLDRDYQGGTLHDLLASLATPEQPLVIVSTNYDTLLEQAFRAQGKPFDLVVYPSDSTEYANSVLWWPHGGSKPEIVAPNMLDIDLEHTTVIYKMHGTVDRNGGDWDNFVVTEEDYVEFLSRMTINSAIPSILFDHFLDRNFLFLGYGLRDWNLRVILRNLGLLLTGRRRKEDLPSWAIQWDPSELERMLWESRKVKIFDVQMDSFVEKLEALRDH